jgi:hypothetical protein
MYVCSALSIAEWKRLHGALTVPRTTCGTTSAPRYCSLKENIGNFCMVTQGAQSDISVVTGLDSLQDDGHRLVLAGLSPVVAENPEADCIIMAEWSNQDYEVLLDLVYGEESR